MLASIKRLFAGRGIDRDLTEISAWALRRGHGFRRARDDQGFVLEGVLEGKPWRLEWGPPQRPYIEGYELRLRMELDLPSDMQMLVLSRPLMDSLERKTFEEFTDNVQTQIGTQTPEEMRWLVMFPKVNLTTVKTLRTRFGSVASAPATALAWIEGPLANALAQAADDLLQVDTPFVLMTLRGRAYLRMQLAAPQTKAVAAALAIFEIAVSQALRVAGDAAGKVGTPNSGGQTAWQTMQPDDTEPPPAKR